MARYSSRARLSIGNGCALIRSLGGFVIVLATGCGIGTGQAAKLQVRVEAVYVSSPEPAVEFVVDAPKAQTIPESALPWGSVHSVSFLFQGSAEAPKCPVVFLNIAEPIRPPITVLPGAEVRGRVPLERYCPNLAELTARGPVFVQWTYTPSGRELADGPIVGAVIVPKGG